MHKKLLSTIIIVVIGGVVGFVIFKNFGSSNKNNPAIAQDISQNTTKQDQQKNQIGVDTSFLKTGYKMTATRVTVEGVVTTIDYVFDSNQNYTVVFKESGKTTNLRLVDGIMYMQNNNSSWVSLDGVGSSYAPSLVTATNLGFNLALINGNTEINFKQNRDQNCISGLCRVYRYNSGDVNKTVLVMVDKSTDRLSEVNIVDEPTGDVVKMVIEYATVAKIIAPEGATKLAVPGL